MSEHDSKDERERLTALQYAVTREGATEPAFSGDYVYHKADGIYHCVCCDAALFGSGSKYDSGSGWPSFTEPGAADALRLLEDLSHGMRRIEVRCARCDAHLGHVFDDGPGPGGKRYCINSASLNFADETGDGGDD